MTPRVALVGAGGYGLVYRRALAPLHDAGTVALVALGDVSPVRDAPGAPVPPGVPMFTDHQELLSRTRPDVVVIATPPHTHLPIAIASARAGADLLLEKPPVMSLADHRALAQVLADTGQVCQVGFQALGSAALTELTAAITGGALGTVTGVAAIGLWQRPDSYYHRTPWAGRRHVDGRPSLDGALANPFAHAVMQAFAVAEAAAGGPVRPVEMELERYRARPIEVDDTAVVRVRLDHGPPVVVAVTLCADDPGDPEVLVLSEQGRAVHGYTTDQLRLPGRPTVARTRTSLLENLLAHRATGAPLLAPLARTVGFTTLIETITAAPLPTTIDAAFQSWHGQGPDRVVRVPGISEVMRRCAEQLALPSELGAPWADATERQHIGG